MAPSTHAHEFQVSVPPEKLWAALQDFEMLLNSMKPIIESVETVVGGDKTAVGDVRIIRFSGGLVPFEFVKDEVIALDESSMTIGMKVLEGGWLGIEVSSYSMRLSIRAGENGGSNASWIVEYEPIADKQADVEKMLQGVTLSIKSLEAYLLSPEA